METSKNFGDYERVKNAAKELIRAIMWEHLDIAQGEDEEIINEVIDECMEKHGDFLIEYVVSTCQLTYAKKYINNLH